MLSSRLIALVLAGVPAVAASPDPAPPSPEVVERIVAVVDERPLLLSDLRALMAVRGLAEGEALEAAIDERLMHLEASRLPQADVSPEEEDRSLSLLLETRPRLRVDAPEPDLRRLLRRQLAILKYVEFRFRPQLRIGDDEVRKAWEEEQAGRPAGPALEDAQEEIREKLERRALGERIEAWVRELRARADVRYVGSAAPGR